MDSDSMTHEWRRTLRRRVTLSSRHIGLLTGSSDMLGWLQNRSCQFHGAANFVYPSGQGLP